MTVAAYTQFPHALRLTLGSTPAVARGIADTFLYVGIEVR